MPQMLDKEKNQYLPSLKAFFLHHFFSGKIKKTRREIRRKKIVSNDIIPSFVSCSVVDVLKKIILWKTYV